MPRRHVCRTGSTARRLLAPGARGRVLAGFSKAAYLVTGDGELLWLASEDAPMHPRAARIEGPFPRPAAGEEFLVEGGCVRIAPDLEVEFGRASTWAGPEVPAGAALEADSIPGRVKGLFRTCVDVSQARGFGRLIPDILALSAGEPEGGTGTDPVLALAWPRIRRIARAALLGDMRGLPGEADVLVGLGGGLTPSGDDFLGGLLFCVHAIRRLCPGFVLLDSAEQASFMESARGRTHLISFTLLEDLGKGHAVEPLHELIHSILCGRPAEGLRAASCLIRLGHSTGWDLLSGALTGLLPAFRRPGAIRW